MFLFILPLNVGGSCQYDGILLFVLGYTKVKKYCVAKVKKNENLFVVVVVVSIAQFVKLFILITFEAVLGLQKNCDKKIK